MTAYCNRYASDLTELAGAFLPTFESDEDYDANTLYKWLCSPVAEKAGWQETTLEESMMAANAGLLALASWRNRNKDESGHIQAITPGTTIENSFSQAGRLLYTSGALMNVSQYGRKYEKKYFVCYLYWETECQQKMYFVKMIAG